MYKETFSRGKACINRKKHIIWNEQGNGNQCYVHSNWVLGNEAWRRVLCLCWAAEFFLSILPLTRDFDDNEYVESLLRSNRGLACKHPHNLIHDEQFCISAREYVRLHGNLKDKPDLTCSERRVWHQLGKTITRLSTMMVTKEVML